MGEYTRVNCAVPIMKGNAGINMYSFKATLFEVFEVLFGKPRKRGNIFGDKTKVSFGKKKNHPSKLRK